MYKCIQCWDIHYIKPHQTLVWQTGECVKTEIYILLNTCLIANVIMIHPV